jgi:tRNA pseudouridine55 synthase
VERAPREIEVFGFEARALEASSVQLEVACSKGTYVRTLAEDIARALGTCGHVSLLRRLHVEPFEGEAMVTLEAVAAAAEAGQLPPLLSADRGVPHLPAVRLSAPGVHRVTHGQAADVPPETPPGRVRLYDESGGFFGIGEADGFATVRPRRLFVVAPPPQK